MGEKTKSAVNLLQARIKVQEDKLVELVNATIESKLKFEELAELANEMKQAEVEQADIKKVLERIEIHKQENIAKYREYEQLKIKLEENREMLAILESE